MDKNQNLTTQTEILKTQRILVNVGPAFVLTRVSIEDDNDDYATLSLNEGLVKVMGLKNSTDKSKRIKARQYLTSGLLFVCILFLASYPTILNSLEGDCISRLVSLTISSLIFFIPVVVVEVKRKVSMGGLSYSDIFRLDQLAMLYLDSILIAGWNLCFVLSLRYTQLSSAVFLSNLLLLLLVSQKKFFGGSRGLSEVESKGALWLLIGVIAFFGKIFFVGNHSSKRMNIYEHESLVGLVLALAASFFSTLFYKRNYDSNSRLPKYLTIFIILGLSVVNYLLIVLISKSDVMLDIVHFDGKITNIS